MRHGRGGLQRLFTGQYVHRGRVQLRGRVVRGLLHVERRVRDPDHAGVRERRRGVHGVHAGTRVQRFGRMCLRRDVVSDRLLFGQYLRSVFGARRDHLRHGGGGVRSVRGRTSVRAGGCLHLRRRVVRRRLLQWGDVRPDGETVVDGVRFRGQRLRSLRGGRRMHQRSVQLRRRGVRGVLQRQRPVPDFRDGSVRPRRYGVYGVRGDAGVRQRQVRMRCEDVPRRML